MGDVEKSDDKKPTEIQTRKPETIEIGCVEITVQVVGPDDKPLEGFETDITLHGRDDPYTTRVELLLAKQSTHKFHVRATAGTAKIVLYSKTEPYTTNTRAYLTQHGFYKFKFLKCKDSDSAKIVGSA